MIKLRTGSIVGATLASMTSFFSSVASAQVVPVEITYAPLAASIPTLSSMMLVLTAIILGVVAFHLLKSDGTARMMGFFLVLGSVVMGVGGLKIIGDAYAALPSEMDNPNGGKLYRSIEGIVENKSGVTQQIVSINCLVPTSATLTVSNFGAPECSDSPSTILKPSEVCTINPASYNCGGFNGGTQ